MNFSEILKELWSRSEGNQVFLPMADDGTWYEPEGLHPTSAAATVNWMLTAPQQVDYYFTPLKYDGLRRRDHVGGPGVIFADMDDDDISIPMVPSLLIETSPGHMHGYWFLDHPVSLKVWEPYAREWSRHIGADPGGWDATQVLRLPGTPNMKYDHVKVRLLEYNPELRYLIHEFPEPSVAPSKSTAPGIPSPIHHRLAKVADHWDTLPLSSRYYLTMTEVEYQQSGITDRSEMLWGVIQVLLEAEFTAQEIFGMMSGAPWDKYVARPGVLWQTITKAAALYLSHSPIVV